LQTQPRAFAQLPGRRLFLTLCISVVVVTVAESLVDALVRSVPPMSWWAASLIDAAGLSALVLPALYFLIFRLDDRNAIRYLGGTVRDITEQRHTERALQLFRALIDHSTDAIEVVDHETLRILDVNDRACRDLGYTREELLSLSVGDIDAGVGRVRDEHVEAELKRTGHATFETLHRRKDGGTFPCEVSLAVVALDRPYVIVVARDITVRLAAEATLRLEAAALNAAANPIIITDRSGTIVWTNAALAASVGYDASEVIGKNPRDLFRSGVHDHEFYRQLWETVLAGRVWRGEMTNRRKDGSFYTEDMTITPIIDTAGDVTHFVSIKVDITDFKRAEDKLREQAELLDHAQDAIVVTDLERRITYWNRCAERIYGWSSADAGGQLLPDWFCPPRQACDDAYAAVIATGEWSGEVPQSTSSGARLIVKSRWSLVRDASGAPRSVLMINTDITEQKHLELQFLRAQRLESIGTLAGGIAHDLNNILTPIIMSIELLKQTASDDDKSLIDTIGHSAERGADMVGQVLSFARGLEGRRVDVQVRHLIREIEKIARETFPKNVRVTQGAGIGLWTVSADPTQLHQVLLNLCINARDAMPGGGQIVISASNAALDALEAAKHDGLLPGPYIIIEVSDTGSGIPPAIIDKIFDPFFTTKDPGLGTGLGLSTSLTIVKRHGGSVSVTSQLGKGTTFAVILPAQAEARSDASDALDAELPRGHGETVLVVDDELAIREITRQTLEAFGYKVLVAADGSEGVSIYAQNADIGAVIIDMMMPNMDGATAIQVMTRMNPAVRIIAISGRAGAGPVVTGDAATRVRFLPKPFSAEALLQKLSEVLPDSGPTNL
jgi:PAS domain S-box-containing protein